VGNPFDAAGQVPEIYAYGFRNPYRFAFDDRPGGTGDLIMSDVGQGTVEEIIRRVSAVCPIDRSPVIEGRPAQGGIVRPSADPNSRPEWPEAFWLLNHHSVLLAFLGQLVLVVMIGTYGGTQPSIMVEAAPAPVRCTAVGLGYNICLGVIGGLTPLAATWLVSRTGDEISPAFLIMAAAAVTFATILRFRETYRAPFVGSPAAATACA
jgi:hypothetical protein